MLGFLDGFRRVVVNGLFLLLLLLLLIGLFSGPVERVVEDGSVLVLAPTGSVVEEARTPELGAELLGFGDVADETELGTILDALAAAAADDRIAGVLLDFNEMGGIAPGMAEAFADALADYRDSGKPLMAVSDFYNQSDYLLASQADEIYMHPFGQVLLNGYGAYQLYLGEMLERFGVNVHVYRAGTYKAATEPFSRGSMSEQAREAQQTMIDQFWDRYVERVSTVRRLEPELVRRHATEPVSVYARFDGDAAIAALEDGLIDELLEPDEIDARVRESFGVTGTGTGPDGSQQGYRSIDFREYVELARAEREPAAATVALVHAEGTILDGDQPRGVIGSDNLASRIRRAREDASTRALVLRINSPGGSAFASERIRRELELTQLAGMPVVISMSGVAASGGYWLAATADEIWAAPSTITGSIGVFAVFPTFEQALERIEARVDGVGTGPFARPLSPLADVEPQVGALLQQGVDNVYGRFLSRVASGREMPREEVDRIAQGRVWTGADAHELGLVDALGHVDDALRAAAALASLDDWTTERFDRPLTPQEQFAQQLAPWIGGVRETIGLDRSSRLALAGASWADWATARLVNDPFARSIGRYLNEFGLVLEQLRRGDALAFCEACLQGR